MPTHATIKQQIRRYEGGGELGELLGRLKAFVVTGGNADTNLACNDADGRAISATATILLALEIETVSGIPTNRTHQCTVTAAGYVQCSAATNSDRLVILAIDRGDNR